MAELRIVSLIASATEIVAALGLESSLVGRSHECDYPPSVLSLPACSEPKIDVAGTSRQIDARVKSLVGESLSVYRVFPDLLQRLRPTHIITQTQCEVCAVSLKDVEQATRALVGSKAEVVSLAPMRLDDVWGDILTVGRALGVSDRAEALLARLKTDIASIAQRSAQSPARPTIACVEWIDPLMAAGNWVPELVEIAGGLDPLGQAGKHSPWLDWQAFVAADPDVIAVLPCGFDISRTLTEMSVLTQRSGWSSLRAVRRRRVYLTDGNQFFNRPGPRLVESARILGEILHPHLFEPRFQGKGWIPFETSNGGLSRPAALG